VGGTDASKKLPLCFAGRTTGRSPRSYYRTYPRTHYRASSRTRCLMYSRMYLRTYPRSFCRLCSRSHSFGTPWAWGMRGFSALRDAFHFLVWGSPVCSTWALRARQGVGGTDTLQFLLLFMFAVFFRVGGFQKRCLKRPSSGDTSRGSASPSLSPLPSFPPSLLPRLSHTPPAGCMQGSTTVKTCIYLLPLGLPLLVPPGLLRFGGALVELMRWTLVSTSARFVGRPCLRAPCSSPRVLRRPLPPQPNVRCSQRP
jgi:hypothetical protein